MNKPPTTTAGLLVRMDAESVAGVAGNAEVLDVVMVYYCSVSV